MYVYGRVCRVKTSEIWFTVAPTSEARREPEVTSATDLDGVGAATAAVIDSAEFTASDVAAKRVSYDQLCQAGVEPAVADRLRRTYSLVWSFVWRPGSDLRQRAERISGLSEGERAWIAASVHDGESDGELSTETDTDPSSGEDGDCPRCGGRVTVYTLGESRAVECEGCGYAGIAMDS